MNMTGGGASFTQIVMTGGALGKYDWRRRLRGGGSGDVTTTNDNPIFFRPMSLHGCRKYRVSMRISIRL